MGIKGLFKLIQENAPDAIIHKKTDDYSGKVIGIDISLLLYQYLIAVKGTPCDILDENGNTSSHIYGLFVKTINFIAKGIKPIYIFDGCSPEIKYETIKIRKQLKSDA